MILMFFALLLAFAMRAYFLKLEPISCTGSGPPVSHKRDHPRVLGKASHRPSNRRIRLSARMAFPSGVGGMA